MAAVALLASCVSTAATLAAPIGFASLGNGTTGGGNAPIVTVSSASQFRAVATQSAPANIHVVGSLDVGAVRVASNKTIFGATADSALMGSLQLSDVSNVIIRNLTLSNPNDEGEGDTITLRRSNNVWIDHNNLTDAPDGVLDIVQQSDLVTVSWNQFYYTQDWAANNSHRFAMLIGNGDNVTEDAGKLRVTLHHNHWGQNVQERMPRVRYGDVHVFNNYFNTPGNNYAIRIAIASELLIENNSFENVDDPFEKFVTSGPNGLASASGNQFVNTGGSMDAGDSVFSPTYDYTLDDAAAVKSLVLASAGTFLPGDFNGDGTVDTADYSLWRDNLGAVDEGAINRFGDGVGGVTQLDYQLWESNFGNSLPAAVATSPVPEPATLALVLVGLAFAARCGLKSADNVQLNNS